MAMTSTSSAKSSGSANKSTTTVPEATTTKLRILLCSENCAPQINGIARRVEEYAAGFRVQGHHVDLLHPYCQGETLCLPHPWNSDAHLMLIRPRAFWKYVMAHQDYDVIHVVMPLNLSGAWILAMSVILRSKGGNGFPALVISHHLNGEDYITTYSPPGVRDFQKFLIFTCLSRVLPLISDRILTPTRATEPRLLCQFPQSKIGVCHTGISADFSTAALDTPEGRRWGARKKAFLADSQKQYLLLYVGRVAPEKGLHRLLAAMEYLPHCALWVVGDGPYRPQAELIAQSNKNLAVDFMGYQRGPSLSSVYAVADCFVCPSHTETYGQVVQEAIASGVRVALPSTPQFLEAYQHMLGSHAFWIPHDTKSMADAIQALVALPASTTAQQHLMTWTQACEAMMTEYAHAMIVVRKGDAPPLGALHIASILLWMFGSWVVYLSGHMVYFVAALLWNIVRLPSFYVEHLPQQSHTMKNTSAGISWVDYILDCLTHWYHVILSIILVVVGHTKKQDEPSKSASTKRIRSYKKYHPSYPFLSCMFWEFDGVQDFVTDYKKLLDEDTVAWHDFEHMIVTNVGPFAWSLYAFIRDYGGRAYVLDPLCRWMTRFCWPMALKHAHHVFIDMLVVSRLHPQVLSLLADKVQQLEYLEEQKKKQKDAPPSMLLFPARYSEQQVFAAVSSSEANNEDAVEPDVLFAKSRHGAYGEGAQVLVKMKVQPEDGERRQAWRCVKSFRDDCTIYATLQEEEEDTTHQWTSTRRSFHMYEEYLANHTGFQQQLMDAGIIQLPQQQSKPKAPLVTLRVWSNRYQSPKKESHVAALLVGPPGSLCSNHDNNQCLRIVEQPDHGNSTVRGFIPTCRSSNDQDRIMVPFYSDLVASARWVHDQFPQLPFLAFDFALTNQGLVFLEANPMSSYSKYPSLFRPDGCYSLEDCEAWLQRTFRDVVDSGEMQERAVKHPDTKRLVQLCQEII